MFFRVNRTGMALLLATALLGTSATALAEGLALYDGLPALTGARWQDGAQAERVDKLYPLGAVNRISGTLRFADQVHLQGERNRKSWQLTDVHSMQDAFDQARHQAMQQDLELLFWCQGRECGPSNLWANAVVGNSRLYGPDDGQAAAVLAQPATDNWLLLYGVTRGNGRGMLHVEQITGQADRDTFSPSAATWLRLLRSDGQLKLPKLEDAAAVAQALRQDSTLRVSLGGAQAADWLEALQQAGVRRGRMELDETEQAATYLKLLP